MDKRLLSISITLALALGGWVFKINSDFKVYQERVDRIMADQEAIHQRAMLWKYATFLHDQVNAIWFKLGKQPPATPKLD